MTPNDIFIVCVLCGVLACCFAIGLAISSTYIDTKYEENKETRALRDAIRRAEMEKRND